MDICFFFILFLIIIAFFFLFVPHLRIVLSLLLDAGFIPFIESVFVLSLAASVCCCLTCRRPQLSCFPDLTYLISFYLRTKREKKEKVAKDLRGILDSGLLSKKIKKKPKSTLLDTASRPPPPPLRSSTGPFHYPVSRPFYPRLPRIAPPVSHVKQEQPTGIGLILRSRSRLVRAHGPFGNSPRG